MHSCSPSPVPVSASSLLQVEEMEGLGGALFLRSNRGVQRCPSTLSNHAQSVGEQSAFYIPAHLAVKVWTF